MKLQRIADNFRSFNKVQLDDWTIAEILTAIFNGIVSLEHRDDTARLLDQNRIALYSMFDITYGPSQNCQLYVLTVDDELVGLAVRQGKNDWVGQAMNQDAMQRVALDLAAAAARNDVAALPAVYLDQLLVLPMYPIHFLDEAETMFVLRDSRSVYRLNDVRARHRTYFVDEVGVAHAVTHIGEFQTVGWVNGRPPADDLITITVKAGERIVSARQLLFELVRRQGNLEAALKAYHRPASWTVDHTSSLVARLILNVTAPFRWDTQQIWLEFESVRDMEEFVAAHPIGTQVDGEFDEKLLDSRGRVYDINAPLSTTT